MYVSTIGLDKCDDKPIKIDFRQLSPEQFELYFREHKDCRIVTNFNMEEPDYQDGQYILLLGDIYHHPLMMTTLIRQLTAGGFKVVCPYVSDLIQCMQYKIVNDTIKELQWQ